MSSCNTLHFENEAERFRRIANYLDEFTAMIDAISDNEIKEKSKIYISKIESLILQSPEWIYNNGLSGINMGIFGAFNSGWKEMLQVFVDNNDQDYIEDMGIRVKHVIKCSDLSKHLLLIRHESENIPDEEFSNWADCGLFVFRLESERTYKDALLSHKEFISCRRSSSRYAPMILVGCLDRNNATSERLLSFIELKDIAQQCGFDEYFEIRYSNGYNLFFLFEYCTILAHRCRYLEFSPSKNIKSQTNILNVRSDSLQNVIKRRKSQKRKTCIEEDFKVPSVPDDRKKVSVNAKRTSSIIETSNDSERRQSFTLFRIKNKSLPRPSTAENSSSFSSDGSATEQNSNKAALVSPENIVFQGCLHKGRNKKFVTITKDAKMFYHTSKQDYEKGVQAKYVDLRNTSAKVPGNNSQNGYVLRASRSGKRKINNEEDKRMIRMDTHNEKGHLVTRIYKASTEEERNNWMEKIKDAIFQQYSQQRIDFKYQSMITGDVVDNVLTNVRKQFGNDICAECSAKDPSWVVYNYGILVCDRCSGGHRNLGVEISKVCSMKLDGLDKIKIQILETFGNILVNAVMEAKLHLTDDIKPSPDSASVDDWLKKKYVLKKYIPPLPLPQDDIQKQLIYAIQENDRHYQLICLMNATRDQLNLPYDDSDSRTPLMIATRVANIVAVQLLLWAGVNTAIQDNDGLNAHGFASINVDGNPSSKEMREIQNLLTKFNTPPQFCKYTSSC